MFEILKLTIPILLANIFGILAVIINTKIVGDISSYNLYLLTLFMPFSFWVVSLFESFRVPASSVASYAYSMGELNLIGSQVACLLILTLLGLAIPFVAFMFLPNQAANLFAINNGYDFNQFRLFLMYMFPASFLISAYFIILATFNGIGRQRFTTMATIVGVVSGILLNYYLANNSNLQILSMPISSILTNLMMLITLSFILFREKIFSLNAFKKSLSWPNLKIIKKLALPVWITYLLVTLGLLFFNDLLSPFGHDAVAGFGIAYRIQSLILLPAISLGSSIGILLNKNRSNPKKIVGVGLLICMFVYSAIAICFYNNDQLVYLITKDLHLIHIVNNYFQIVSLSYIGFGIFLTYCLVLEQIGSGLQVTLFSGIIFLIEITIAIVFIHYWNKPESVYWAISIGNWLSGFMACLFYIFQTSHRLTPTFIK